jgi:hypothetical protein
MIFYYRCWLVSLEAAGGEAMLKGARTTSIVLLAGGPEIETLRTSAAYIYHAH